VPSPADGKCAVSASDNKTLRVWSLETGAQVGAFTSDAPAGCCAFIDNTCLVAGDELGRLYWLALVE
jgi:WD40 repeat protein